MPCALITEVDACIAVDTESETEVDVKKEPAAILPNASAPACQSEAEMWKAKFEELEKKLQFLEKAGSVPATPASPPNPKPLFSYDSGASSSYDSCEHPCEQHASSNCES